MIDIPLIAIVTSFLTVGVRLTGLMLFAPFFGGAAIPVRVKALFVLTMTLLLFPAVHGSIAPQGWMDGLLTVFSEFAIGAGIGIATNLVFDAAQLAGQMLGVQMGYSLVNILDPQSQVDTPVVSAFYQSILMLIFLRLDVHYWLLRAVGDSFLRLPPQSAHLNNLFTIATLKSAGEVFALGVRIAAPVLTATLAADLILGLLGKASSQMPLMLLGPAVKSLLGTCILIATLKYWPDLFGRLFTDAVAQGERLLHLAG